MANDPQRLNAEGLRALADGRPDAALTAFRAAADLDPGALALWLNVAKAARASGDATTEREALDRALAIDATELTALIRKAELVERHGEHAEALRLWIAVLAVAPPPAQRSPALAERLDTAQGYVAEATAALSSAVDAALAPLRGEPNDTRRFDAAVDAALGRRRIYTNECAGLHFPFLPADEFFARDHFPWLTTLEAATDAIRAELTALFAGRDALTPYVTMPPGIAPNKWTPLDGSPDWSAAYLWKYGTPNAALLARCPATAAALAAVPLTQLPGRAPTVFFSVLRPHARIPPHTGVTNTRTIIHLPLIVPPGCGFRVGGETRQWVEGEAFAFDDTIEHEAWNDSDQRRAVLIFDVWNPYLTAAEETMLQTFYHAADGSGLGEPRA